jgi:NAD+ diphosphatase
MFAFETNPLNRHGDIRHKESFIKPLISSEQSFYLPIFKQSIVTKVNAQAPSPCWLNYQELLSSFKEIEEKHLIYLGEKDSKHYFTFRLKEKTSIALISKNTQYQQLELESLRLLFKSLSPEHAHLCSVAIAMEHWHNTHQYCGYCGHQTYSSQSGFVRVCSNKQCQQHHFPRTDSAVICAITHDDKILLGRQESWPEKRFSVIAGFVEPGETLEQAVAREAYEETGITLTNIRYYQSQPWPFPQSLMVGFTAEATTQTIKLLDKELEQAEWFSRQEIARAVKQEELILPFKYSISRELINQWLNL